MFEELTAKKKFETNKQKKPISFTQKSHSIKLFRKRRPGYFVKLKSGEHRSISSTQKKHKIRCLRSKKPKTGQKSKGAHHFHSKDTLEKTIQVKEARELCQNKKNRQHRCFSLTPKRC